MRLRALIALMALAAGQANASAREALSAKEAFAALEEGNRRFVEGNLTVGTALKEKRKALIADQKPEAIVLSCSDSRVPPELVFDQGLGELFTVRAAGEALSTSTVASIEYAIEHLGTHLLVVLGHESCGAVRAALESQ